MVVCAVHPPASHSAPAFLRQYAGQLGRTALRRELERDRPYLSLHRTGSLDGVCTSERSEEAVWRRGLLLRQLRFQPPSSAGRADLT
ncbi:unnamed protein product [Arctogadus glacialis]